MIINSNGQALFGAVLADDVLIEDVIDFFGLRDVAEPQALVDVLVELLFDDLVAELDALVADVHAGAGNELAHLLLRFTAEAALELPFFVPESEHLGLSAV